MSAQAVGGAFGHNSISLIIPCHRVIGSTNESLTGYTGGIEKSCSCSHWKKQICPRLSCRRKGPPIISSNVGEVVEMIHFFQFYLSRT